jgi:hypothetical protein
VSDVPQSYANHPHRPVAWNVTWLLSTIGLVLTIWLVVVEVSLLTITLLVIAAALVGAATVMRLFAIRLQDRIIRLEMQVRLAGLGLMGQAANLSLRQLIALRFASDAELPALMSRAAAESLTPDQIKRAVVTWRADDLRT